jgi:hypothetical protein
MDIVFPVNDNTSRVFASIDLEENSIVTTKVYPAGLSLTDHIIHPSIVPVKEIICSDMHTFAIMKYMEFDLRSLLKRSEVISNAQIISFVKRVCVCICVHYLYGIDHNYHS